MRVNIAHIFLLSCWFSTAIKTNDNHLGPFTDITLQHCQQLYNGGEVHEERMPNDVIVILKIYTNCIQQFWMSCTRLHNSSVTVTKHRIFRRPCLTSSIHLNNNNYTLHIQVQQIFQINLTFTLFNLKRSTMGCVFHNIKVGNIFISHNDRHLK